VNLQLDHFSDLNKNNNNKKNIRKNLKKIKITHILFFADPFSSFFFFKTNFLLQRNWRTV
tara:strand:- start:310 stop:489 length:180 start_codon:yes stop_codon:yes gene_type:complete